MANVNGDGNVKYTKVETYKIADSQSLTFADPLTLSSGKVQKYATSGIVPNTNIGFAAATKSMGVLATVGQQEYIGVIRKGLMKFTGLKDSGSYTNDINVGDKVSLYYDGSDYYVVNNSTNPIGVVISGSMDTVGSSTTIMVEVDLTIESVTPGEIGWPLLVPTDSKIEFRDTGIFIHSSADGQLTISSDGATAADIKLTGNVTIDNDLVVTGSFSGTSEGKVFTGLVQINDNFNLQFEGVSGTADGFTINCDSAGDTKMDSTAGYLEFNSKDAVFTFQDSDDSNDSDYLDIRVADAGSVVIFEAEPAGHFRFLDANAGTPSTTDYLEIIATEGSSRQIIAAEPSGLFRFKDAGDANNSDVLDLDLTDAAAANIMTSAVAFEIATTAGNIVLDSAGDIVLEAAGADINMDAALNITITGTPQLELIESGSVKTTVQVAATSGACTVTTAGGNANHFEIATGTAGNIILDSAGTIEFEPTTTATFTLAAAGYISIDAGTNDSTAADVVLLNVDVNSTNCNAIGIDLDVGTALSAGELAKAMYLDINQLATDADTSGVFGVDALMTAVSTSRSDLTAFRVLFDGTRDTDDAIKGLVVDGSSLTVNSASAVLHGINIEFASVTDTDYTTDEFNAIDITMPAAYQGTDIASAVKIEGAGATLDLMSGSSTIYGINMVLAADTVGINIDAGSTDHTAGNIVAINLDVNSATANAIHVDLDVGTALSAAESASCVELDFDGAAGDDAASFVNGLLLTGAANSGGTTSGIKFAGTMDRGLNFTGATVSYEMVMSTADAGSLPCVVVSGTATNDAGIVSDIGADANFADGSLYISVVDGAGKLFQKQNDVWIDLQA